MDYGNYGRYLYNLHTGETVGVRKQDEDSKNENNTVEHNGETWNMIGNDLSTNQEYGTVEDLSFEQLCNLFLQGNLEVDEFVKGLKSKENITPSAEDVYSGMNFDVRNIKVTQENGTVTVTFDARAWDMYYNQVTNPGQNAYTSYSLTCSVNASESQTDDKVENTLSEETLRMIIAKYGISEDDIKEYFSEVASDNYYLYGKSALSSKIYKINNDMTVQELEKYLSKNYKTDINAKFSTVTLADAGITQTLLAKYFKENEDGTYSIKPGCVTDDGQPITCLEDIRDTYSDFNVKSFGEFLEKTYSSYIKNKHHYSLDINSLTDGDIVTILSSLTGSNCSCSDGDDYQYLEVIGEALQAKGYLDGETVKNYKSHDNFLKGNDWNKWTDSDEFEGIMAHVRNAINEFASDIAKEIGKNPDIMDMFKYVTQNMGFEIDLSKMRNKYYEEQVKGYNNIPGAWYDDMQKIIGYGGMSWRISDYYSTEIVSALDGYINTREPNSQDCYTIGIIFKAAGITDADSMEVKNEKFEAFIAEVEKSSLYYTGKNSVGWYAATSTDVTSVYEIFDYLQANGYIDEHTYDQANIDEYNAHIYDDEEFHEVVKDVVLESFIDTNTSDLVTLRELDNAPDTTTPVTEANYKELEEKEVITPKTEEEHEELCEEVLKKLIHESNNIEAGNYQGREIFYSNRWLLTILDAMGATDISTINGALPRIKEHYIYTNPGSMSFTLDGHKYVLPLAGYNNFNNPYVHNTNWYDSAEIDNMKQKLRQGGFPEVYIDRMFKLAKSVDGHAIDGEKCYMIAFDANQTIAKVYRNVPIHSIDDVINFINNIESFESQKRTNK